MACGGLWLAVLPEENLDEILENQEPLRWGVRFVLFSSELDRPRVGLVGVFEGDAGCVPSTAVEGGEADTGGPAGVGLSRAGCDMDLRRAAVLMVLSSREHPC